MQKIIITIISARLGHTFYQLRMEWLQSIRNLQDWMDDSTSASYIIIYTIVAHICWCRECPYLGCWCRGSFYLVTQ